MDDEELLCEYELVNARVRLLQRDPKEYTIASTLLTPDETVALCIDACLYEQAFRISILFKLPLEPIFSGMTSKYVHLLNNTNNRRRIDDEMLLSLFNSIGENRDIEPLSMAAHHSLASLSGNANLIQSFPIDLLDIFYENGSNTSKSAFISYSSLSICDRMWHLIMYYLTKHEINPQKSSHLMKQVAEKLLSNNIMLPTSLVKIYKVCSIFLWLFLMTN